VLKIKATSFFVAQKLKILDSKKKNKKLRSTKYIYINISTKAEPRGWLG
jgi:hypothetical protein